MKRAAFLICFGVTRILLESFALLSFPSSHVSLLDSLWSGQDRRTYRTDWEPIPCWHVASVISGTFFWGKRLSKVNHFSTHLDYDGAKGFVEGSVQRGYFVLGLVSMRMWLALCY